MTDLEAASKAGALFRAASVFLPVVAPSEVPYSRKALGDDPGPNRATSRRYDAAARAQDGARAAAPLADQGEADAFLTDRLEQTCEAAGQPSMVRRHAGYDHGCSFAPSFLADQLRWRAKRLQT